MNKYVTQINTDIYRNEYMKAMYICQ